ncbi:extracellular elastinolytic metallo proteinase [Lentithecium fluviatile CBS 122367]|uniref:Extracellular metalloproteinase n=1 Tax=Lentithecium fluviatile CBS 122367 TaxID=1168545 RepID=A0A6G1IDB1_9PLEO|nr:extracellular elastinolytic metallo proteinase [Lentithecium fluviatile CBS 122367]
MVHLQGFFYLAGLVAAHPVHRSPSQENKRAATLHSYRFDTIPQYTTIDVSRESINSSTLNRRDFNIDYVQVATRMLQETAPNVEFRVIDDHYIGANGVGHVHFQQVVDGVDVVNADFNANVLRDGTVVSFGGSLRADVVEVLDAAEVKGVSISPLTAFRSAVNILDLPIHDVSSGARVVATGDDEIHVIEGIVGCNTSPTVKRAYFSTNRDLFLTWRIELDMEENWLLAFVDATTGEVAGVVDYTNGASYEVYPWGSMNPTESSRRVIVNPENEASSPFGWHSTGTENYTTLRGNNVYVKAGFQSSQYYTDASSPSLLFSYPYSPAITDPQSYALASATQAFYTLNKFHDILYTLGFDEAAGNFQVSNNGKGGRAGDPIQITFQEGGTALTTTPLDGTSPRIQMGVWTVSGGPSRDSVFDATVLIHEAMHCVTGRLVGGGATSGCLSTTDGLSINEGYSDLVATLLRIKQTDSRSKDYTVADWATGQAVGLRSHYISTNMQTTPLTFQSLNELSSSGGFDVGTTWTTAVYEVFWNMAEMHGIGEVEKVTLDARGVPQGARYLLLKLILDSEALLPCSPHHLQGRDALVQADQILTGGENKCAIWRGFAKRGFGEDAVRGSGAKTRVNGFKVLSGC